MMTPDEWDEAEREIVREWMAGSVDQALSRIDDVLSRGGPEARGRALVYRGSIREEAANWQEARTDFTQAVGLFNHGSYPRFTAELSAGYACENLGDRQSSLEWYRAALHTCSEAGEPFSGAVATKALLALAPALTPQDMELLRAVTVKSWRVLSLPGEPDLSDLASATEALLQRASRSED